MWQLFIASFCDQTDIEGNGCKTTWQRALILRAEFFKKFCSYFGHCNDFIFSFWNFLTFKVAEDKANSMTERIGYPEYITNDTRLEGEYTNVSPHGMCTLHFGNGVHNGAIILCTVADLRILMAPARVWTSKLTTNWVNLLAWNSLFACSYSLLQ